MLNTIMVSSNGENDDIKRKGEQEVADTDAKNAVIPKLQNVRALEQVQKEAESVGKSRKQQNLSRSGCRAKSTLGWRKTFLLSRVKRGRREGGFGGQTTRAPHSHLVASVCGQPTLAQPLRSRAWSALGH